MADKVKQTKTPAKPARTATKIEKAVKPVAALRKEVAAKAKTPAKPRKAAAKQAEVVAAPPAPLMPAREEIERLARQFWAQRGYQDGHAEQDWLRAERELLQKAS